MDELIDKLKNKIDEFQDNDLYIEIENAIQYQMVIKNSKIIVSKQKLIISDEEKKDLIIELHYIYNIEFEDCTIKLIMDNDLTITLTY